VEQIDEEPSNGSQYSIRHQLDVVRLTVQNGTT